MREIKIAHSVAAEIQCRRMTSFASNWGQMDEWGQNPRRRSHLSAVVLRSELVRSRMTLRNKTSPTLICVGVKSGQMDEWGQNPRRRSHLSAVVFRSV